MVTPAILKELSQTVPVQPVVRRVVDASPQWILSEMYGKAPNAPVHDAFGKFLLLEEIGHGADGQVYLGQQLDLGNRLVVLKITEATGAEHLSLARLQHTNIVPLFGIVEDSEHRQRALCMPFFGRATLKHIFLGLTSIPCCQRTSADLLTVLDQVDAPQVHADDGPARTFLRGTSFVEAICWIGAALADALQYAHERGMVHLDVKPSNVLLAGDGQPMLLDFHLARPPLQPGEATPALFGGTPSYMAPEQEAACADIRERQPIGQAVDARADVFGLGMVLYEALSGRTAHVTPEGMIDLRSLNPQVSVGLSDVIGKSLAWNPVDRYPGASALAADLRCHLHNRPLQGVPNRNLRERWQKWRRRRPHALLLILLVSALVATMGTAGLLGIDQLRKRCQLADEFFVKGRDLLREQQFVAAQENLSRGLELAEGITGNPTLAQALREHLRLAERAAQANKLRQLADSLRQFMLFPHDDQRTLIVLDVGCGQVWEKRDLLLSTAPPVLEPFLEQRLRRDLGDLAVGWAELKVRLASPGRLPERKQEALALLTEAAGWGVNLPELEWQRYDPAGTARKAVPPRTAWELYLSGRCLFRIGKFEAAARELEKGVQLDPGDFYGNFCLGVCAAKLGRHPQAIAAFSVCIGQDPLRTEPFLHRGRSQAILHDWQSALADFDRALRIRPNVPEIVLERARAYFHLDLRQQAQQDLGLILKLQPRHAEALALMKAITNRKG